MGEGVDAIVEYLGVGSGVQDDAGSPHPPSHFGLVLASRRASAGPRSGQAPDVATRSVLHAIPAGSGATSR